MNKTNPTAANQISTGIGGLDHVLTGGLPPNRLYLVEGDPGTGKTTLAMQFLLEGRSRGERVLYITLSETTEEIEAVAQSHGWSLEGIDLFELANAEGLSNPENEITLLHPWEVELGETINKIVEQIEQVNPARVVFDSLSELRLLAQDPLRYRRQILSLKQFFVGRKTTVMLLDDRVGNDGNSDRQLHSICHGVISLERLTLEFGAARRRLEVKKLRGLNFRAGWHDLTIRPGGVDVFPHLNASEHYAPFIGEAVPSGLDELDALLHGGPLRGTSTLLTGPAGGGKTTIALRYALTALERGEKVVFYEFDERLGTLLNRGAKLNMNFQPYLDSGLLHLRQVDPLDLSPGEFSFWVKEQVENNDARMVIIDSLNGYFLSMPEENQLLLQVHELLSYLNQQGVVTFLLNPQHGLMGTINTNLDISYIADTVLLVRYFESDGRIRKAISVVKNRSGGHENTIREFIINESGIQVGEPLTDFHGIFTGTPTYSGSQASLMNQKQPWT